VLHSGLIGFPQKRSLPGEQGINISAVMYKHLEKETSYFIAESVLHFVPKCKNSRKIKTKKTNTTLKQ
jgi:hypothetical protein